MDDPAARYDRIVLTTTPALIACQFVIYFYMLRVWRPKLTPDAIAIHSGKGRTEMTEEGWKGFHKDASALVMHSAFHLWFGLLAYSGTQAFLVDSEPSRALGDRGALMAMGDVEYARLQEMAAFLGSIFAALMLEYTFFWLIGWDRDPLQLFHHLTFLGVTVVLARRSAMCESGLMAMAMEGSSPFLNLMNVTRQLDGTIPQTLTMLLFVAFFLSFLYLRCYLFGKAVSAGRPAPSPPRPLAPHPAPPPWPRTGAFRALAWSDSLPPARLNHAPAPLAVTRRAHPCARSCKRGSFVCLRPTTFRATFRGGRLMRSSSCGCLGGGCSCTGRD